MSEFTKAYVSLLPSLDPKKVIGEAKSAGKKAGHFFADEFDGSLGSAGSGIGKDFVRGFGREAEKGAKTTAEHIADIMDDGLGIVWSESFLIGAESAFEHIGELFTEALEHEKLGDKAAAALGLSEEQAEHVGHVAGKLYAGAFGESLPDVTNAVESVISSIDGLGHAAPEELEHVTAGILNMAEAFELDASEGARNVGILIKQGLAKDAEEGIDLITASLQRVPKALRGEVTDATQEYSQFFADVGFSGSQALGLLVGASEDGQFGIDKMGDAIKEFTIRSTDLSKTSGDAFKTIGLDMGTMTNDLLAGGDRAQGAFTKIITGLQGIKDPGKQAEAAIALFGTPLEDLGTNEIPKFLDSLSDGAKGMGDVKGAAEDMGHTLADNVATDIESVKRSAELFITEGLAALFEGFESGEAAGSGFERVMSTTGEVLAGLVDAGRDVIAWMDEHRGVVLGLTAVMVPLFAITAAHAGVMAVQAAGGFSAYVKGLGLVQKAIGVVTAVQWAWTAAMAASGIPLIIAAIVALVAGLVWFFTKTKTGKKIIEVAWGAIKAAVKAVVDWWTNTALPAIKRFFGGISKVVGAVIDWVKKNWPLLLAIITGPIGLAVLLVIKNWDKIKAATEKIWNAIKTVTTTVWEFVRDKVLAKFKDGLTALKEAFGTAKDGIATIWNRLKKIAAKPVNFIIKWVYNKGIVPLVGGIFEFLNQENPLKEIAPIEFARGGWTGPGARLRPAGIVHADEFVINKGSRRRIERQAPGALDFMNSTGRLPGYAEGGTVARLSDAAKWWQNLGARVSEFSAWGQPVGRHTPGSLHYVGRAADLNYGPSGENPIEKTFFDKYLHFFRKKFPDIGVLWRVADHFNHMHIDTGERGSSVGDSPGKFNLPDKVASFTALFDTLKKLGDNPFGGMLRDMGGRLVGGVIEWVKDRFAGSGEDPHRLEKGGAVVGTVRDAVRAVAATRGWDTGAQWDALAWIINTESGWDPNAANAASSARGLFQKMTSLHGPIESTVKAQTEWGLDYIAGRYGTPRMAQRHHMARGWYADGGHVTPKLYDSGGWLPAGGIGVNRTGKPEAVLTPEESDALRAGLNRRPVELHFYGQRTPTVRDVVHALNVADLHDVGVTA